MTIWDLAAGRERTTCCPYPRLVGESLHEAALSPDGRLIAVARGGRWRPQRCGQLIDLLLGGEERGQLIGQVRVAGQPLGRVWLSPHFNVLQICGYHFVQAAVALGFTAGTHGCLTGWRRAMPSFC